MDRLGKAYPNIKFVLATAPDSTKQAADLEKSVEGVLKHVPFPVRPVARKMLRG